MRVIAGEYKGRRLKAVPGDNTRPTTDKVKESIFNIIGPYFAGGWCLDLFAGSGGLGIEAVSRGMDGALLLEKNRKAVQIIKENIEITKEEERFIVIPGDARKSILKFKESHPEQVFELVIIDPPYKAEKTESDIQLLVEQQLVNEQTVFVCEMDQHNELPNEIGPYYKRKRVAYGTIAIEIFEA